MILYDCQVCGQPCFQVEDEDGLPSRPKPCPRCEAEARIAAADMPHLTEARRLYLALMYVTAALDQARPGHRLVERANLLLGELEHLRVQPAERKRDDG